MKDEMIANELLDMNMNLSEHGTEMIANYKNIDKRLD